MWCFVIKYAFKKFKEVSFEFYALDPFQYFNSFGLGFGNMVKMKILNFESVLDFECIRLLRKEWVVDFLTLPKGIIMLTKCG